MLLKKMLQNRFVWVAVIMAIIYQLAMVGCYVWGFSQVSKKSVQINTQIVNQDAGPLGQRVGHELAKRLSAQLTRGSLTKIRQKMRDNQVDLAIVIPKHFSNQITRGKVIELTELKNQGTQMIVAGTVRGITNTLPEILATMLTKQRTRRSLTQLVTPIVLKRLAEQGVPTSAQVTMAQPIVKKQVNHIFKQINAQVRVKTHRLDRGRNQASWQMAPMFLTMAVYLGGMIATMTFVNVFNGFRVHYSKWQTFVAVVGCQVVMAVTSTIAGVGLLMWLLKFSLPIFAQLYLQMILLQLVATNFALIPSMLFQPAGLWINIPLLMAGAITGTGTLPLPMLPTGLSWFHAITPLYPAVKATRHVLFQAGPVLDFDRQLLVIGLVSIGILLLILLYLPGEPEQIDPEHA